MSGLANAQPVKLFPPSSNDPSLAPSAVPYANLLGTWHVVASTLPLWKGKKNVTITYSSIPDQPNTTFDDLVSYNQLADAPGKAPSTVRGVDRLEEGAEARWKWRGKGLLMIASSRWQLLGFHIIPSSSPPVQTDQPEWVVTYFASTLFTPAGLDIYSRTPRALSDEFVEGLIKEIDGLGGQVADLVKDGGMFRIPHD